MPGFMGIAGKYKNHYFLPEENRLIQNRVVEKNLLIEQRSIKKFERDKIFSNNLAFFALTDGVIFNLQELITLHKVNSSAELCLKMYDQLGETFFNTFRGSFSGIFYDKKKDILLIYTDHIGDKPIFYSNSCEESFYFGSELKFITSMFSENDVSFDLNLAGAYSMLTYSFLLSDLTYIKGVHRLTAGRYIKRTKKKIEIIPYHVFEYNPNYSSTDNAIIEQIDQLFDKAITLQVNKDKEYRFKHIAALSGGLDTRMTNYGIKRITKNLITNFTYSPVGFPDETISKKISKSLLNSYIYQSNDNGNALMLIDEGIRANEGLMTYYGSSVLVDFFNNINMENYGLIHTGQIGDGIVGSITKKYKDINQISKHRDAYSIKLTEKFCRYFNFEEYRNSFTFSEVFSLYNKGLNGVNSGSLLVFQQFTESFSPFLDVDFFDFCLTIPLEKRLNFFIYDKWIKEKHPEMTNFSHNGKRYIGKTFDILKFKNYTERASDKIAKKFNIKRKVRITSVTPLDYWYEKVPDVRIKMDSYFNDHIKLLDSYPELKYDCIALYQNGTTMEKNQVLTLIGVIKKIFSTESI